MNNDEAEFGKKKTKNIAEVDNCKQIQWSKLNYTSHLI